ncbi:putative hydrolase [Hyphodiscus hymeniophilus]|uniref:Hydrolase n=1 Tax=Hyphodiscus hymeniophilus TaxID=353542 RepID=A0A9P6VIK1_9HELO|nr:putative hydrolase [Hyphodiscus hymeniophilus]
MPEIKSFAVGPDTSLNVNISGNHGPTLIFLHFWGGSTRTYSQVISKLSLDFCCIAIDFPGWGSSTGPQSPDAYSITQLAIVIESLIPRLEIGDFTLVGHSMGGKVAQLITGRRLVKGLKGVVLVAPAPPTPLVLPADMKEQQLSAYSSPQSAEFVARNVLSSTKLDDETIAMLVEDMTRGNEFAKAAWPNYAMAEDIVEVAKKIDVPILVIAGELDKVETLDRVKKEVLCNVNGAEIVVVLGSGHLLPVEAPGEVSSLVREFVEKL